jgi:hypothetical protein
MIDIECWYLNVNYINLLVHCHSSEEDAVLIIRSY